MKKLKEGHDIGGTGGNRAINRIRVREKCMRGLRSTEQEKTKESDKGKCGVTC